MEERSVAIPADNGVLDGELIFSPDADGIILFAHGSGSSRFSPRNRFVAEQLQQAGFATLLFDLLTEAEDQLYPNRFDIPLLTHRLLAATRWVENDRTLAQLPMGYFGASTGAAAALAAAAAIPRVRAVVSRGGRPDLALTELPDVRAATLLIVGGEDDDVIRLNRKALACLTAPKRLEIVPGATHLFEEPGTLNQVAQLAAGWFRRYLVSRVPA